MNEISLLDYVSPSQDFVLAPFFRAGSVVNGAHWGMTLKRARSMRFRWNEKNEVRDAFFSRVFPSKTVSAVELIHSKIVVESSVCGDTKNIRADGIATKNLNIIPVVTVADCVPIFLFDEVTGAHAAIHSGWKGTGIAGVAVNFMEERFSSRAENILVAIGAHIGSCCYSVDDERRTAFAHDFGEKSVSGKNLSLKEANIFVLKQAGILEENITVARECTCCTRLLSSEMTFGSFRREAAFLPEHISLDERSRAMTVQAAFVVCD